MLYCGGEVTVTVSLKKAKIRIMDHSMLYYSGEVPANIMIVMQLKIWVGYILAYMVIFNKSKERSIWR